MEYGIREPAAVGLTLRPEKTAAEAAAEAETAEKYLSALGQSPEAIALMETDPSRVWLQSFNNCIAAESWYQLSIRLHARSRLHP